MQNELERTEQVDVTGELVDTGTEDLAAVKAGDIALSPKASAETASRPYAVRYILLPAIFLSVALFGGLRLSGIDSSFIFLKPALICLIFAAVLMALYFRSGLLSFHGWFSEDLSTLKNIANGAVLASLFAATTQLFNSLLPEQGVPFWIVAFCFFWTLWNNLFADFDTKKLLRSLGGLFGLAFLVKYLVLANLAAPEGRTWFERIIENPGQEAMTWLLDLPRFSAGTGYIQFFVAAIYLFGLYLLPRSTRGDDREV